MDLGPPRPLPDSRICLPAGVRVRSSGVTGIAISDAVPQPFALDALATAIIGHLDGGPRLDELIDRLHEHGDRADLEPHVPEIVRQLAINGLIEIDGVRSEPVPQTPHVPRPSDAEVLRTMPTDRASRRRHGAALLAAIRWDGDGAPPSARPGLDGITARAALHGVTGYVRRAYGDRGLLSPTEEQRLAVVHEEALHNHLLVMSELSDLVRHLAAVGIRPVVMKGPVLAEELHRDPGLRSYGDLDLLIAGSQLRPGLEALEARGAVLLDRNWSRSRVELPGQLHLRLAHGTSLDLHWNVTNERSLRRTMGLSTDAVLDAARPVDLGGTEVWTLSPEHTLLHLAQHAVDSGLNRLVWSKDIALAATRDDLDWSVLQHEARRAGLELVLDAALSTSDALLGPLHLPWSSTASRSARVWGRAVRTAQRLAPPHQSSGEPSVLRMLARSSRPTLARTGAQLTRKMAHIVTAPAASRIHPRSRKPVPDDPHSAYFSHGGPDDRDAFLDAVAAASAEAPRQERRSPRRGRGRVLIIVQNLPVLLDRRVWQECQALVAAGRQVSVICPRGEGEPRHQVVSGVTIRSYPPAPPTAGTLSFAWEFAYCWVRTALLSVRCAVREGFDVIQACNPPDTYFALAVLYKPFRKRFVYDQHDLCPELYRSRFDRHDGVLLRILYILEALTYRVADHVIAPNESYRRTALGRGRRRSNDVTVVRSGPDLRRFVRRAPRADLRKGRAHLACYVGVMGPQDGIDRAIRAVAHYIHELGRDDCHFAFLGDGDARPGLEALAQKLGVTDWVTFTGMVGDDDLLDHLSTASVGLCPDPATPLNDVSTMNKVLEYMAVQLPMVSFDLTESRFSAGDAALYVPSEDIASFATGIATLIDDPSLRAVMGERGHRRIAHTLSWEHQIPHYLDVYDRLLGTSTANVRGRR